MINKELESFLKEYETLTNKCNFDLLIPLIDENAIYWFSDGSFYGIKEIRKAFEDTWSKIKDEIYVITNAKWLVATTSEGVCVYDFRSEGIINGEKQIYNGRGTNIFKKTNGKWKIIHEHLSALA